MRSGEADYGRHWKLGNSQDTWRISYIENTGEVYATRNPSHLPVLVLGTVAPDPTTADQRSVYYQTLDQILENWPALCHQPDGMAEVRARILAHQGPVVNR